MRPAGEIRQAMRDASRRLATERDGATWRELADATQVGYAAARMTADNMVRAGELQVIGYAKRAHSRRWMALLAPVAPAVDGGGGAVPDAAAALCEVMRSWAPA